MNNQKFRITGHIVDQIGQGVKGLRIEAWDKDLIFHDLVGSAVTDQQGDFSMSFSSDYFSEIFFDRRPDLLFKVFKGDKQIRSAKAPFISNMQPGEQDISIEVDLSAEEEPKGFMVRGVIRDESGAVQSGLTVQTVDRDLRSEESLGEAVTDQNGHYEICYTADRFTRAEKATADLVIRVLDEQGAALTQSHIRFNAKHIEEVNLILGSGVIQQPSEYEQLVTELTPLLNGVSFAELEESGEYHDISFLSGETGQDPQRIEALVTAYQFETLAGNLIGEDTGDSFSLTASVFYGLFREGIPTDFQALLNQDFYILRKALENALDKNIIPSDISTSLDAIFEILDLLAEQSAVEKPVHHIDVQQKRLHAIGEFIGLEVAKMNTLINRAVTFFGVNDTTLAALVETGEFQEQEAKEVGLAVSLYHLFDGDMQLLETVKSGTFQQLPQGSVNDIKDLVALNALDWEGIIRSQENLMLPDNLSVEEYASLLSKKIEKLYPSDTLLSRLIRAEQTEMHRKSHTGLQRLANMYKGLKIPEIIDNPKLSADDKDLQLSERIGLLSRFQSQNLDTEFLTLDYAPESEDVAAIDFSNFSAEEEQMTLSCFKAYQRMYAVSEDVEHCQTLMAAGYDSALSITNDSEEGFRTHSGLSADISHDVYTASLDTAGTTATLVGSIIDAIQGGFDWTNVSNQSPGIGEYLKKIEGFEALFGSQAYCKCEHCRSILSPAAYFVDLMSFVEKNILIPNFSGDLQGHVLNLKTRRQDLWELPLTCENTHGLTSYLDIINEVLENYIFIAENNIEEGELPARSTVEQFVYGQKISCSENSFQLPKLLPLKKLETYLFHFKVTRGEIAKLLEKDSDVVAATVLKLSRLESVTDEYDLITQPNISLNFLRNVYGIHFRIDSESGCIKKFDAQKLLSPMGLTRAELGELIKTEYVRTNSQETIRIKGEKRDESSVQEDIERIVGLTLTSLDRMHRFIRLWRQLSWSISELDLVLSHLNEEGVSTDIETAALYSLVILLELQERFGISVEEMCTLWSSISREVIDGQEESLFDRLFNLPEFVLRNGRYPKISTTFTHPDFEQVSADEENSDLPRLLAGLRLNNEQLYQLITHLSVPLELDANNGFYLSVDNLSLLYRHARLAQWLKVTLPQLFQLVGQAQSVGSGHINDLNALSAFLKYYDWWRSTDYSIDDISYILGSQVINRDAYPGAEDLTAQILDEIEKEGALIFADTIFAYLDNVTEDQSKIIIETNSGWIANVPDSPLCWLASSFDSITLAHNPREGLTFSTSIFSFLKGVSSEQSQLIVDANPDLIEKVEIQNPIGRTITACRLAEHFVPDGTLAIPDGITIDEADARKLLLAYYAVFEGAYALLISYHITEVFPLYLARHLDFTVDKTKALVTMTGADLTDPEFISALHSTELVTEEIIDLVEKLLRLNALFCGKLFDADALDFVNREQQELFGINDFNAPSIQNIQRISLYADFISGIEGHSSLDDLQNVLLDHADNATLANVLNAEPSLIVTLIDQLILPLTALEALDKLRRCVEMLKYLSVGGNALNLIVSEDYEQLSKAGDAILGAFRAKYDDEKEWAEKIAPYEEKLRTFKRDVLTDYLIYSSEHTWCTSDKDLYYYFLLDVELEGCAQTSKVVAAISSLQLYAHRVLMNLEQSENGDIQVIPLHQKEFIKEWEWRKNYRVWEANRKVFLYPENWIEPELRDNKTPLFEALESELLQQEINEQTVLDAYANYMQGFEELAHLKIAGSYHEIDTDNKTDKLHLFGVTSDEPPIYYYRAIENTHYGETEKSRGTVWSPWRKIDVQIPVSKVSPIIFRNRLHVFWVEITTRPKNEVKDGSSKFVGYQHKMSLKYTSLRLDGSWTTPQRISLYGVDPFKNGDGVIEDPLLYKQKNRSWLVKESDVDDKLQELKNKYPNCYFSVISEENATLTEIIMRCPPETIPKYDYRLHTEPMDGYTLTGYKWDQVYPEIYIDEQGIEQLKITGRDWEIIAAPVDFYQRTVKEGRENLFIENTLPFTNLQIYRLMHLDTNADKQIIYYFNAGEQYKVDYPFSSLLVNSERATFISNKIGKPDLSVLLSDAPEIGNLRSESSQIETVNGSFQDVIMDLNRDLLLFLNIERNGRTHLLKRLGTTLSEPIARALLTRGVNGLLDIETQKGLVEKESPIEKNGDYIDDSYIRNAIAAEHPDFKGAFGTYYREIFFHIPFLIANHLNSQQKFHEARKWYQYIFDPTAGKEGNIFGTDFTPTPEGQTWEQNNRKWRYIEFRNLDAEKLRERLTDAATIETYRKAPFNPHAIARLRLSAYQKTIVMKYIDNLLDWGDNLFSQDTMESINEATLLYALASDILGERPAELGECSEIPEESRNYNSIKEVLAVDSPFLTEMEYYTVTGHRFNYASPAKATRYTLDPVIANHATQDAYVDLSTIYSSTNQPASVIHPVETATSTSENENVSMEAEWDVGLSLGIDWNQAGTQMHPQDHPRGWLGFVKQISPVFCIPENRGLKQYWDRVEDRLYKIRNCMNISGVRRELSLFAPEIDPGLLVRAKAAGLSIEDVLNAISGNLPPYRFAYVIEKAKSYAATVQGFGAALLSALEKKDMEELTLLRAVHEQNIMKMTRQVKQREIDAATENIVGLERRIDTVQHRRDYYQSLVDGGLSGWEHVQQLAHYHGIIIEDSIQQLFIAAGIAYQVPQVGSPFAITYGGKQIGAAFHAAGSALNILKTKNDSIGSSAGLEANNQRREQNWKFQLEQAEHELKELEKQIKGAEIHKDLTKRSLEIHEKSLEQLNEVYEFYGDKFSNLGLYTWLSTTLQRLYREAYNSAYSMAKLAEQTYRFERSDDTSELLGSGYWEAPKAGLLAGERLSIDLQNLERKFIETNYRSLEINQSFSLSEIAPAALIVLKEIGNCEFDIAEIFFDLSYPGHYRRKIKSARLTIPCVTGSYTNVSATLTLQDSSIRIEPKTGNDVLKPVPRTRTLSIATSSAQNDSGVFELNFHDERYMPFEGAGAISSWKLSLPTAFRQFDYETISDVLIHISYTAEEDGLFREQIEELNANTEGTLLKYLSENSLPRIFSLHHEFSNEFHRLLHSPRGTTVTISLTDMHFPAFLKGNNLNVTEAKLLLKMPVDQSVTGFTVKIDNTIFTVGDDQYYNLPAINLGNIFTDNMLGEHTFVIEDAGAFSLESSIYFDKLEDILLFVAYKIKS